MSHRVFSGRPASSGAAPAIRHLSVPPELRSVTSGGETTVLRNNPGASSLTRNGSLISSLKDVTPFELGNAATHLRQSFSSMKFDEILMNPFDTYPMDYKGEVMDV